MKRPKNMKRTTEKELMLIRLESMLNYLKMPTHTVKGLYKEYSQLFRYFYLESK